MTKKLLISLILLLGGFPAIIQADSIPFSSALNYGTANNPYSVFCADLDGDFDIDLAVTNEWSLNVSILKNNGDGTF